MTDGSAFIPILNKVSSTPHPPRPRFDPPGAFTRELEKEATAYFEGSGRSRRDLPRMYLKGVVMVTWFVMSWVLLVFFAKTGLTATALAISLGLSIAGIGMSVQHDGNHGAASRHAWVNRVFGCGLDIMGVASFIWRQKHNSCHHTFTNVQGVDYDLDFGILACLSPEQRRRWYHRYQHVYLWFFYGFLLPKWVFHDDFIVLKTGYIGTHALIKPTRSKLIAFFGWKVFYVGWSIVIPAMLHPLWQVVVFHMVMCFALGLTLGTIFQLAHCTNAVEFPAVPANGRLPEWTVHQLATTVDFAPKNPLITWFVGGLNFQSVHHLFPKVSHLHYPALSVIVARVATAHGVKYRSQPTLWGALSTHVTYLRDMGKKPAVASMPLHSPTTT